MAFEPLDDLVAKQNVVKTAKDAITFKVGGSGRITIGPESDPSKGAFISTTVGQTTQTIGTIAESEAVGIINALKTIHAIP